MLKELEKGNNISMKGFFMKKCVFIYIVIICFRPFYVAAQACCSAGVPLLGSLELSATPVGNWQFSLTYEYNYLNDVLSGTEEITDDFRERTVHSALFETSYGFARHFSASLLLALIQQEREIGATFVHGTTDFLRTRGAGDAVFLIKYSLIPLTMANQREIAIGLGPKFPLGRSGLTTNGVLVPPDMQPGSGAWDGILWAYFYQGFLPKTTANIFSTISYRLTGTNNDLYRFRNEFTANLGTSYRTNYPFDFSLAVRFRQVQADRRNDFEIDNTGGTWISAIPGVNIKFKKDWSLRLSGQIPLYRELKGTQLTTSYRISTSLFYSFSKSKLVLL